MEHLLGSLMTDAKVCALTLLDAPAGVATLSTEGTLALPWPLSLDPERDVPSLRAPAPRPNRRRAAEPT